VAVTVAAAAVAPVRLALKVLARHWTPTWLKARTLMPALAAAKKHRLKLAKATAVAVVDVAVAVVPKVKAAKPTLKPKAMSASKPPKAAMPWKVATRVAAAAVAVANAVVSAAVVASVGVSEANAKNVAPKVRKLKPLRQTPA
jgi:hypothetical protein